MPKQASWAPVGAATFSFAHYGSVQRRRGGWYAILSTGEEIGPLRLQRRARDLVEAHAVVVQAEEQQAEKQQAEAARLENRSPPPSRRRRRRRAAEVGGWPTKLRCDACGVVMTDEEPCAPRDGEFTHPRNECRNAGKSFVEFPRPGYPHQSARGIAPVMPSRFLRAKRRGAKLASRYRPKR